MGFVKPCLINEKFAKEYGFNSGNSIIYNENNLYNAMKEAIFMRMEQYLDMQEKLKQMKETIY
ncbi:MAG: hypothetical protein LBS29_05555 [Endomicrobium sp.]|nr:hypothetical protein [Endomicrobium sp.]